MDKYTLTKEIIKMCQYFKVIKKNENEYLIEKKVIDGLEDIIFVENLINIMYKKAKFKINNKKFNINKFKKIMFELEKNRLNLEFKEVKG